VHYISRFVFILQVIRNS